MKLEIRYSVTHRMSADGQCWSMPWLFKGLEAAKTYAKKFKTQTRIYEVTTTKKLIRS